MLFVDATELLKVRRIVAHVDCPDGLASAMILHDALPDAAVEFVQYNTPRHTCLAADKGMLFCDFSPPRERVAEFVKAGAFVLDHHDKQRGVVEAFGDHGVFGDNAKLESGAWLAFREVWVPLCTTDGYFVREFAALAAVRDTWQTDHPNWQEACEQAEALRFYGPDYFLGHAGMLTDVHGVLRPHEPWLRDDEKRMGVLLFRKRLVEAKQIADNALCVGDVVFFPDPRGLTSDVAEALRMCPLPKAAMAVGFFYVVECGEMRLVFSMRSLTDGVDVVAIAKANGGGGHVAAAGFSVPVASQTKGGQANYVGNLSPIEVFKSALGVSVLVRPEKKS